jgi:hypothetical protein
MLERLLRPGRASSRDVLLDVCGLVALALLLMAAGFGLRDPWPADEPRFALVAQDILRSGDWLMPRAGGDPYADKPPFFFWLMATAMALTGSMRAGFLLPSLLAGIGTTLLVYDLLRRARGRDVALAGAFLLLLTFQFTWQARQAQIDAVLCLLTTLSLYGLLRHVVLGPAPKWFVAAWVVAGLGVITKGVGFLPLLALVPFAALARRGWPTTAPDIGGLSLVGAAAMLVTIGVWFVPMMLVTSAGGELLAYRNEILFQQTVTRYADAWHHHEPFWYYLLEVIPLLWLPLIALVPWLWPRWRVALRERDTLVALLLAWVVIVIVFFSASPGKRGVYLLPAVPALAMAAAPWLPDLLLARGPRRLAFGLATALVAFPLPLPPRTSRWTLRRPSGSRASWARRSCCRWLSQHWRVPSRSCCCGWGTAGWPTRACWLPSWSRSASWSFLAVMRSGPGGRSSSGWKRRAPALRNLAWWVGGSNSCCTCGGPASISGMRAGAKRRPRPRTQRLGLLSAPAGRCWSSGACVKRAFRSRTRSTSAATVATTGSWCPACRTSAASGAVTALGPACTCRQMLL